MNTITAEKLEQLWQEYQIEINDECEKTLAEHIESYGEAFEVDEFLCNALPDTLNNYYYVRNASLTEYYFEIVAGRRNEKGYDVTLETMNLKSRTTPEIIAEFINRNEDVTLN